MMIIRLWIDVRYQFKKPASQMAHWQIKPKYKLIIIILQLL